MRTIETVREHIQTEEFDYLQLLDSLNTYRKPRDAITRLLKAQSIIRVKKGLYVFGRTYRRGTICKESLANLIYGPSYISLEYALRFHNLIPERVEQITSMTPLRNCTVKTPVGVFEYAHLHLSKMAVGVTQRIIDKDHQILIATPEKALADRLAFHPNLISSSDVREFVCDGLRIEEFAIRTFRLPLLEDIEIVYKNPAISALVQFVKELQC